MSKCAKCDVKLRNPNSNTYITCNGCKHPFHGKCVSLETKDLEYLKNEKRDWFCPVCVLEKRSNRSAASPLPKPLHQQNNVEFFEFERNNSDKMLEKIYDQLKENTVTVNKRFDSIDDSVKLINMLVNENAILKEKIVALEIKADKYDQFMLDNAVEIVGLPSSSNVSDTDLTIKLIQNGLQIRTTEDDFDRCFRVRSRIAGKQGKVIVYFHNKTLKHKIMKKMKEFRKLSSSLFNSDTNHSIYINDSLTPFKRKLFNAAKQLKSEKSFKYLWMRNYSILMRKSDGGTIHHINSMSDLDNL